MTLEHRIEIVEGVGRPVLRKWALTPAGEAALAREAERLARARHPGVVALLDTTVDHLDLDWAGAETMALARLTRGDAARVLTQVAATVADLHDRGIVHGRLDASHVVIGAGTSGILCGLRGAGPGRAEPGPADDVGDIGRLLQHALGMGADADLVPERRWRSWSRPGGRDQVLEELAERAADPDPARRPTARALARALAEVVPDVARSPADGRSDAVAVGPVDPVAADAPDAPTWSGRNGAPAPTLVDPAEDDAAEPEDPGGIVPDVAGATGRPEATKVAGARLLIRPGRPADPHAPPRPSADDAMRTGDPFEDDLVSVSIAGDVDRAGSGVRRPALTWVGGALALVVVGLALSSHQAPGRDPGTATAATAASVTASAPTTVERTTSTPPSVAAAAAAPPTSVRVVDATTVEVDGQRYRIGQPGDRLAIADWDCNGSASPGLVRSSTGEVFVFDRWPTGGATTAEASAVVPGAQLLIGSAPGPGCTAPQVELADGGRVPLLLEVGR